MPATFQILTSSRASSKPELLAHSDRDVAHLAMPGMWTSLGFLPILLFTSNYPSEHPAVLITFATAVLLLTVMRLRLATSVEKVPGRAWRDRITVVFGLMGLTWGAFVPVTFYFYGHKGIEGLMSVLWLAGSCPSVISILAPHLMPLRAYLFAAVIPGILGELFLIQDAQPAVAVLLAVFLVYMLEQANAAHVSYWKNLESSELLKAKAAELEILKAEAENANRAKSELLAKVTEEIRQPLYDIIGLSAGLLDAELPPEPVDQLRNVKFSADSLLHRVSDLHDYACLESGEVEFDSASFHLQEAVGMALRSLKPAAEDKGLQFHAQIDEEVPRMVTGDPWRLQQLLSHLVTNAIKFTDEGEVTVDIRLDSWQGKEVSILFVVTDTGPGIPAEYHDIVFQAFSRPDATQAGCGLGLPISARIAKRMGGRVWIESEPGCGAKLYATVRLVASEPLHRARFRTLPVVA